MSSEKDPAAHKQPEVHKPRMCGGITGLRPVNEDDLQIWDMVPTSHKLKPVQVATQVVAGMNYFFKVELPDKKYATARVYHVPWQQDTHGKAEQVAVHAKLSDSPTEDLGHF
ncbi:unnamed protein product [Rotaria sp. Silwood2]|nr:unnamed protein product [Rotaria sp. Silwood2]CAF3052517.1 unnamed protein product [Rotaria sp. Silwood2]CAF3890930.1 unnamed protein product [Rotaria sp. Silwood2]CAF3991734.1 unnamed protein product [Rotaria sp. Silwood2]CAF4270291.1 unnamed protein product [Rotaria sp. Silwood2]